MANIIGQSVVSTVERKDIIYTTWSVLAEKDDGVTAVCVILIPSKPIEGELGGAAVDLLFYRAFGGIVNVRQTVYTLMSITGVKDIDVYVSIYRVPADPVDVARDMLERFA